MTSGSKSFQTFRAAPGESTVQATVCFNGQCTVSNVAYLVAPQALLSDVQIVHNQPCFGSGPGTFFVTAFFNGWQPGDPLPSGVLTFEVPSWPFPVLDFAIQASAYNGTPGVVAGNYYFEGPGTLSFTVSFAGDDNWPADSASVDVTGESCGGP